MTGERLAEIVHKVLAERRGQAGAAAMVARGPDESSIVLPPGGAGARGDGPGVRPMPKVTPQLKQVEVSVWHDPVTAFEQARKQVSDNDRIVVFGSFSTVGPVLQHLGREAC